MPSGDYALDIADTLVHIGSQRVAKVGQTMPTPSKITFEGDGPFDLPVAQFAGAESAGDTVVLMFRILVQPTNLATVRIAVSNNRALQLAQQIADEAAKGIPETTPEGD